GRVSEHRPAEVTSASCQPAIGIKCDFCTTAFRCLSWFESAMDEVPGSHGLPRGLSPLVTEHDQHTTKPLARRTLPRVQSEASFQRQRSFTTGHERNQAPY